MSDVFKAIADASRRQILLMVTERPRSVNELAEHFSMSRPAVSKHIKALERSGLIEYHTSARDGRSRECHPCIRGLVEIREFLQRLESTGSRSLEEDTACTELPATSN